METHVLTSFGDLLKAYRKQQGFTQQQLARKLDLHQNTVGAWERGDYLPATRGMILEIARCLHLPEADMLRLLEASLLAVVFYWGLPSQRNPFFTGRLEVLQQVHLLLSRKHNRTSYLACALSGMGGIGKTQTAIEYSYRYARDYAAVLWVNAETEESLLQSFASIARALKLLAPTPCLQEDVATPVLSWLMLHRDWLLIFDNVRECTLVRRFVPTSRYGALLVTTRLPTLGTLAPCLELLPLDLEEGTQLLLKRTETRTLHQHSRPISSDETTAARTIAAGMSGLPLALDLVAAYIEEAHCRFSEFLGLYQRNILLALQAHPTSATYPHSVDSTFTLAFVRLQEQNQAAARLLSLCCFCAPEDIPEALVVRGAPYLKHRDLQEALGDPVQVQRIFTTLLTHALLRRDEQSQTLRVHRLVQVILKGQLPEAAQRAWTEQLIHLLDQFFLTQQELQSTPERAWDEQLLPHVQHVLHLAERWPIASGELASLLCKTAIYLSRRTNRACRQTPPASCTLTPEAIHPQSADRSREVELLALRALSIYEQQQVPDPGILSSLIEELARARAPESESQKREPRALAVGLALLRTWEVQAPRPTLSPASWQAIPVSGEGKIAREREVDSCETFLRECCTFSVQACCQAADLWQAYQAWALTREIEVSLSRRTLNACLQAKGCSPAHTHIGRTWRGLELKTRLLWGMRNVAARGGETEKSG
ncbi:MAG TPA: helix-turn-helix transcriptional regulator [Ktedonobacteraceae bacterium]